ncbi:hypothetical protein FS795_18190 [Agrobacterium vitis]|nr:hypothetical protein [Allorhizobium ampelinum]
MTNLDLNISSPSGLSRGSTVHDASIFVRGLPPSVLPDISPSRGEIDKDWASQSTSSPAKYLLNI